MNKMHQMKKEYGKPAMKCVPIGMMNVIALSDNPSIDEGNDADPNKPVLGNSHRYDLWGNIWAEE